MDGAATEASSAAPVAAAAPVTAPPVAARRPHRVALGAVADGPARGSDGDALITPPVEVDDDLFWLRDDARAAPDVLAHLRAESEYFVAATAPLAGGAEALARELRARLKEADAEAPWRVGNFTHYLRTEEGASYPIHCRRRRVADPAAGAGAGAGAGAAEGGEEIVLDENAVADGHEQCDVHHMAFSPSQDLLAFPVDFSGAEEYAVRLVRLGGRADGTGADYASSAAAATAAAAAASSAAAARARMPCAAARRPAAKAVGRRLAVGATAAGARRRRRLGRVRSPSQPRCIFTHTAPTASARSPSSALPT